MTPGVSVCVSRTSHACCLLQFKCDYVVFLEMKVLACSVGEPTETFFSLWRKDENRQITDEFQVTLTAQGMPYDVEKIGNIKTVFKDITQDDVDGELYLAVRLIRRGKLSDTKDSKPGKSKVDLRRPFGGGVLNITSFTEKEGEHSIAVYQANSESTFWNMRESMYHARSRAPAVVRAWLTRARADEQ